MESKNANTNTFIFTASLLALIIFVVDTQTPRGVTEGFLYMIVIMFTLWMPGKNSTIIATLAGVVFTLLGFYFSPPGIDISVSLTNRLFAILGSFITMFVVLKNKEKEVMMRRANDDLEKSLKELKDKNFDLEQYAYIASHDLQEPLRKIANYISLLEKQLKNNSDEETKHFMNVILKSAERMKIIITDVLLFSRITRDRVVKKTDCHKVFTKVLADLSLSIRENQAIIKADHLPVIDSNETEMHQLLLNLIGNAIKFKKKNTVPEIQIHCVEKENEWEFSVVDNGIGIENEYLHKIFLVFQRLHSKSEYAGTGIGLAICKKIIDAHEGRIWVTSTPGTGSAFYFTIRKLQTKKV